MSLSMCVQDQLLNCVQLPVTPWTVAPRLLCQWDFPGKNTAVGCHFLLQGIFPNQGSNPCLLHLLNWQVDSLPPGHLGSPREGNETCNYAWKCITPMFSNELGQGWDAVVTILERKSGKYDKIHLQTCLFLIIMIFINMWLCFYVLDAISTI